MTATPPHAPARHHGTRVPASHSGVPPHVESVRRNRSQNSALPPDTVPLGAPPLGPIVSNERETTGYKTRQKPQVSQSCNCDHEVIHTKTLSHMPWRSVPHSMEKLDVATRKGHFEFNNGSKATRKRRQAKARYGQSDRAGRISISTLHREEPVRISGDECR